MWIQGDLHAENFGTYMDGKGVLVFDVNDFDEAYLGHFTWDLRRFVASVASAAVGRRHCPTTSSATSARRTCGPTSTRCDEFVENDRDHEWALRLDTATGAVKEALLKAQLSTRVDLLDQSTVVEDYQRRFRHGPSQAGAGTAGAQAGRGGVRRAT